MRFLKLILFSVVFLFLLLTAMGLLFPSNVLVSRAIDMQASAETAQAHVGTLTAWNGWLEGMDKAVFNDKKNNIAQIGNHTVELLSNKNGEVIAKWIGKDGSEMLSTMRIIQHESSPNTTTIQWQFEEEIGWLPWERFGSMMHDKILGAMLEKNLANLKSYIEQSNK